MARPEGPSGVLLVRAWVDGASSEGLRARIIQIQRLDGEQTETTAATVDQVLATVRAWLETLLLDAGSR